MYFFFFSFVQWLNYDGFFLFLFGVWFMMVDFLHLVVDLWWFAFFNSMIGLW